MMAALSGVVMVVGASCGGDPGASDQTASTLGSANAAPAGPEPGDGDDDEATDSVTTDDAATGTDEAEPEPEVIGPALPAGASAEEILAVVADIHGPTDDLAAHMARLVPYPLLPTPAGASIQELRAEVRESATSSALIVTSEVMIVAPATTEELLDLYVAAFAELGWEPSARAELSAGATVADRRSYVIPGSAYGRDDIELLVAPADNRPPTAGTEPAGPQAPAGEGWATARIRIVEIHDGADRDALRERFEGWHGALPLPGGGRVTGTAIQTSYLGRGSLHYSTTLRYEGTEIDDLVDEVRGALPAADFTIRATPSMGDTLDAWIYLDHPFFEDARISPHPIDPAEVALGSVLNVYGRVPLAPAAENDDGS